MDFPEVVDEFYPVGGRLSAKYRRAVGYDVMVNRMPRILESAIELAEAESLKHVETTKHAEVVHNLRSLLHELRTNAVISTVKCPVWNAYKETVIRDFFGGDASKDTWLAGPFLRNETYMYHRIHEILDASALYETPDIFRPLKEQAFLSSIDPMTSTLEWMASTADLGSPEVLQSLLEISIWGNRCDMALDPGADESQKSNLLLQLHDLKANFEADDSNQFWAHLKAARAAGPVRVAYVTDNAGFEFFGDLCLTSTLLKLGLVDSVTFYVKKQGLCISDVMVHDLLWMIQSLVEGETEVMRNFGKLLQGYLEQGKYKYVEHPFWTYPYTYDQMKTADPGLYRELATHQFVVIKGDLSYRRLIGDLNWPLDTPFEVALQSFHPAPVLSLRTIKVDVGAGLSERAIKRSSEQGRSWMLTGEFATIQFCNKTEA